MNVRHSIKALSWLKVLLMSFLVVAVVDSTAEQLKRVFELGSPGAALGQPNTVQVAAELVNTSGKDVIDVRIDTIHLNAAGLLSPLPLRIGNIRAGRGAIVEASFSRGQLIAGKEYALIVRGTYELQKKDNEEDSASVRNSPFSRDMRAHEEKHELKDKDKHHEAERRDFSVKQVIVLPPDAPGQANVGTIQIPSSTVKGGRFPHQPPHFDNDVNQAAPPVPTTPFVSGVPTPTSTGAMPAPFGDPPAITFKANNGLNATSAGVNCSGDSAAVCAEPSGASGGGVVFATANWLAAYSTDGGNTFTQLDPTKIFPNDAVGFCCDQIVQYVPSIDRFVWLLQGTGYRLAMASPADIKGSGGTAWTYWNLTPQLFGQPAGTGFDYPDLSVGNNSLYISWDAGDGNGCPTGCTTGFQVVRTSLTGIQAGGTITLDFTNPSNGPQSITWGDHITQNTGGEVFWAGHNGNATLRVFSLAEGSNTYFWRDVGISSWANNAPTSTTPDGRDWLAKNFNGPNGNSFPRNGIIGATRSGNQIWFAWTAGTGNNFSQPHVEMVALDRSNNFNKIQQVQIWNNSYAFGYPALSTNFCTGEIGISFEYGGNGNYENHVVGFWGDYVAYITTGSDVGTDRYGDYVTIRQAPLTDSDPGNLFTAFGFGINKVAPPGSGSNTDVHYILFGRPASSCQRIG
jgi:hypothetical protein